MQAIPQAKDSWQYRKMVRHEQENNEAQGIMESLGLARVPNPMASLIIKMDRDDARRMPALFGTAGREGQAFEALGRMEVA